MPQVTHPALSELLEPRLASPGAAWVPLPLTGVPGARGAHPGQRAAALAASSGPSGRHPRLPRLHEGPERLPLASPVLQSFRFPH